MTKEEEAEKNQKWWEGITPPGYTLQGFTYNYRASFVRKDGQGPTLEVLEDMAWYIYDLLEENERLKRQIENYKQAMKGQST
ncbi:MAG: hypothetical protein ACK5VI_03655 [Opitutia bacterium]